MKYVARSNTSRTIFCFMPLDHFSCGELSARKHSKKACD